jgi:pyruvate formate lyase activating enzyme
MSTTIKKPGYIANYWHTKADSIICTLCPHACALKEGNTGKCRTRKNISGSLISIVYGYPCAIHIDPVEKKPLYHFHPGSTTLSLSTTGCNLHCLNCQNHTISQADFHIGTKDYISPELMVQQAIANDLHSISYTYTDPIVYYEYTYDIAKLASDKGLKNIIVSAGYINPKPLRNWCNYINAANIDLKSFDDSIYQNLNSIRLKPVLRTLEILKEEGVWLEITNLVVPEYTDDLKMIKKMCNWLVTNGFPDNPIHFSRFFPTYKLNHLPPTPIDTLHNAYKTALDTGIKYVYLGNIRDSRFENTNCHHCNALLIERSGYTTQLFNIDKNKCSKCNSIIPGVFES